MLTPSFVPSARRLTVIFALLSLSACADWSLRELQHTMPSGSPMQVALARGYLEMAETQATNYDWTAASIFSEKGLAASYGSTPAPETLEGWELTAEERDTLGKARARLMTAFEKEPSPALADAQLQFDCWVDALDDVGREENAELCRQGFENALADALGNPTPFATPDPAGAEATQSFYLVPFEWNERELNDNAVSILSAVSAEVKALEQGEAYEVVLNGHTDRSGSQMYNLELSQIRATMVKQYLVRAGVDMARIKLFAFGESDPKIPTDDGVREPANRRVEVFIY